MRFHAILVIRDEQDIISECLQHTLTWCDAVYIYDTGSTDRTWEIVQEFSKQDSRIVPFKKQDTVFHNGLRAYVFARYRERMENGDWVLRIDADKLYHISPPEFVRTKLRKFETCVYRQNYDFRLTKQDVLDWNNNQDERQLPVHERRRYYIPLIQSETRMFRYRETIKWNPECSFPHNAGYLAKEQIPIRHYPHRDPEQLQRRCDLRSKMASASNDRDSYRHWTINQWENLVVENDAENLCYWAPDTPLPTYHFHNHLANHPKRFIQRIVHASALPLLDRLRPEFPKNYQPELISS